jgi:hypothetical protein
MLTLTPTLKRSVREDAHLEQTTMINERLQLGSGERRQRDMVGFDKMVEWVQLRARINSVGLFKPMRDH